jgi:transcriptional regulator of acetoin/glycerol metabolism
MSRQPWNPDNATPAQLRLRTAASRAAQKADAAEEAVYEAVRAANEAGVPMEDLAEQTGRSRATLFRKVKPTQT